MATTKHGDDERPGCGKTVAVTGASGFIALHIVDQLLLNGYTVRATVRNAASGRNVATLRSLAERRESALELCQVADIASDEEGMRVAFEGCDAVIHTASPFFIAPPGTPVSELRDRLVAPAVEGNLCMLRALQGAGPQLECLVVTSSFGAVAEMGNAAADGRVYDESCWNGYASLELGGIHAYRAGKVAAERALWEHAPPGLRVCAVVPPTTFGQPLGAVACAADLNTSSRLIYDVVTGQAEEVPDLPIGVVDVEDVAKAHVACLETPGAHGRYLPGGD